MTRLVAIGLVALAALVAGGCASEQHKRDEEQARQAQRGALGTRVLATGFAAALSTEADELAELRKGKAPATRTPALELRLKDGLALLETLEDAEITFEYAAQYFRVRDGLEVPPKVLAHLDADVGHMIDIAASETARVLEFMKGRATWSAQDSSSLRSDVERDRNALRIYRTDIGLSSRLPPAAPAQSQPPAPQPR